jgi:uncharacterized protein (DUF697 family)
MVDEKEQQARKIAKNYMWWSMGAGLIPVPFVDLVAVSGVQLKMLAEIGKIYGVEFNEGRGKALIASLLGYVVPSTLSFGSVGTLLKAIPLVGPLVGAPSMVAFCGASTYAVGKVFIQHFASGGTFLSFDPARVKEFFQKEFEEGSKVAAKLQAEEPADAVA